MSFRLIEADCIEAMASMDESSVDAIVTDPPYGLRFMGKAWDKFDSDAATVARATAGHHDSRAMLPPGSPGYHPDTPRSNGAREAGTYDLRLSGQQGFQREAHGWGVAMLRMLKPGGHLLIFGGTRTYHRLTCALEDAGFEIRDCLAWLYGSGFPKSLNLGNGFGTALKPAFEPIVLARKPLIGSVARNVQEFGTGALNIDGTRIEGVPPSVPQPEFNSPTGQVYGFKAGEGRNGEMSQASGRWPANLILDEEAAVMLDEQSGERPSAAPYKRAVDGGTNFYPRRPMGDDAVNGYGDTGGASRFFKVIGQAGGADERAGESRQGRLDSGLPLAGSNPAPAAMIHTPIPHKGAEDPAERCPWCDNWDEPPEPRERFFYVPKADREERNRGLGHLAETEMPGGHASEKCRKCGRQRVNVSGECRCDEPDFAPYYVNGRNNHPTVKPVELMQWLCRLITPPGGTVLDPFTGSGSTGMAALREGFEFIGIEREPEYVEIARARILGDAPLFNEEVTA